jgi:cob(I)alamin adenosyltransferase
MSIITKRGDDGNTDCLYGRRLSKSSSLIDAIGAIDELNAWIGYTCRVKEISWQDMKKVQHDLVSIMGELSAGPENFSRYEKDFGAIGEKEIENIESMVASREAERTPFNDWQTPSSEWDIACRVCRRAERALYTYKHTSGDPILLANQGPRKEVLIYINRLSDLLWILGRQ